jgi:hypothetical protein
MIALISFDEIEKSMERYFPKWAKWRSAEWTYAGWVSVDKHWEEGIANFLKPIAGQIREVDRYSEGATYWYRKV